MLKNTIEIVCRKPNIAEGRSIMKVAWATLERDQSDAILDVKLEHVATIVESLVAVGDPHDLSRPNHVAKLRKGNTEIALQPHLSIDSVAEGIGDLSCVRLCGKRHSVATAHRNTLFNHVMRTGQHRVIRFALTIAAPINVNDEKTEPAET